MQTELQEKRLAPRFPANAGTKLKLHSNGNFSSATAVDISATGLLLECAGPIRLEPGDQVTCDIDTGEVDDFASNSGTAGRVVRIHKPYVAIVFTDPLFARLRS